MLLVKKSRRQGTLTLRMMIISDVAKIASQKEKFPLFAFFLVYVRVDRFNYCDTCNQSHAVQALTKLETQFLVDPVKALNIFCAYI